MCLPVQVEAELQKVVAQWERDHGRDFVVHDACYLATIGDQWKHQKMEKEIQKAMKVSSTYSIQYSVTVDSNHQPLIKLNYDKPCEMISMIPAL